MTIVGCRIDGRLIHGHRVGDDLGVDGRLADATGDELSVLGAEIDDEDGAGGSRVHAPNRALV